MNAKFLSPEDRIKAIERVQENMTGIKSNTWKPKQSIEALLDIKVWLLVLIQLSAQIANGGITSVGLPAGLQPAKRFMLIFMCTVRLHRNQRLRLHHSAYPPCSNAGFRIPARLRSHVYGRLHVLHQRAHLLHGLEPRSFHRWRGYDPPDPPEIDLGTVFWILS